MTGGETSRGSRQGEVQGCPARAEGVRREAVAIGSVAHALVEKARAQVPGEAVAGVVKSDGHEPVVDGEHLKPRPHKSSRDHERCDASECEKGDGDHAAACAGWDW